MALLDWIARCNRFDLTEFLPFHCAGQHIGWVHRNLVPTLARNKTVFEFPAGGVCLHSDLTAPDTRTAALAEVTDTWFTEGMLPGWRGEHYPATTALDRQPLFTIERSAAPALGLRAWGVHVNGFVRDGDGVRMWVARRARDRPVAPGKWDHMIAGGLPVGMAPRANMIKEAEEEAGLPPAIAERAISTGHVSYCFSDPSDRLRPDTLFTYDLEMPPGLVPKNNDGEVERFALWPIARVLETVRDSQTFKTNCNLVIIDFLVRHGVLTPDTTPHYEAIVAGLRQPFPGITATPSR